MQSCVIITGANGGIGKALVSVFSEAGYGVIATSASAKLAGLECEHFVQADLQKTVLDDSYADSVFKEIRTHLDSRPLKGLINNAAVQILADTSKLDRKAWQKTLDVNLLAPFFWTQAFILELEVAHGCVINIGSIHARLTKEKFVAYATSKAALAGMTRAMAVDIGARVRINAIEPAAIDTDMLKAGFIDDAAGFAQLKCYHPTRDIGQAVEVGLLALMMISAELPFLNGAVVGLDGGIVGKLSDPG